MDDDSDEKHTCPICIEPIFRRKDDDDDDQKGNSNSNGNNRSSSSSYQPVGATVPCGHLFHFDCFSRWQASRIGRPGKVKCPSCNVHTTDFVKLFLPEELVSNAIDHGGKCGGAPDDDISLSSIEEEEESDSDCSCAPYTCEGTCKSCSGWGHNSEEEFYEDEEARLDATFPSVDYEDKTYSFLKRIHGQATHLPSALEKVVNQRMHEHHHPQQPQSPPPRLIVDLTNEHENGAGQSKPPASKTTKKRRERSSSSSEKAGRNRKFTKAQRVSIGSNDDDVVRLKRIAKKFKRQYLQKNQQYKLQYEEKKLLSSRRRECETELRDSKEKCMQVTSERDKLKLLYNAVILDFSKTQRDLEAERSKAKWLHDEKNRLEKALAAESIAHRAELERVRKSNMEEVKIIMRRYPDVMMENHKLKEELKRLQSPDEVAKRRLKSVEESRKRKEHLKALKEMDSQVRDQNQLPPKISMKETSTSSLSQDGGKSSPASLSTTSLPTSKISAGRYSGSASRMLAASASIKNAKQRQQFHQQKSQSFLRSIVDDDNDGRPMSSSKDKTITNDISSVHGSKAPSRPSAFSLMMGNTGKKKIQSTSASRRDFFQSRNENLSNQRR